MKKATIIVGSLIIAIVLVTSGVIGYTLLHQVSGTADLTGSSNVNIMLTRPEGWRKIVDTPVIPEFMMPMLDGSTATIPITAELYRQFFGYTDDQVQASPVVWHSTTHQAYINLIDRADRTGQGVPTSLILVSPPSDEEKQMAAERGVGLDITPVSLDGFVFITHKDNPVDSLTPEQIRGIYTGRITNWNQVGGPDRAITAFQREANSGSQTTMEHLVMQDEKMMDPIKALYLMSMGRLVDAVAEYENGPASIGYTYYYYINNLYRNDNIKVIRVNGIAPTNDNLISGTYPYTAQTVAVIRADEPPGSPARTLRDWLVSPAGQDVIELAGYCKAGKR